MKGPTVADPNWVFVERFRGRMRRVTLLDEQFQVIATHDRGIGPADAESDDCQLLRAVELQRLAELSA
ncbi:MAG: hypothetical protein JWR63_2849 [Conexibacter sp.]|jgi:hypothetical protein|nr:hypothetical protein [Conexibacter sp.]